MNHDAWDAAIRSAAIIVPILMTILFGLVAYANAQTVGRVYDKINSVQAELNEHKDDCSKVDKAVLAEKVSRHEIEIAASRKFSHWVGDCLGRICGKLEVKLPDRPE